MGFPLNLSQYVKKNIVSLFAIGIGFNHIPDIAPSLHFDCGSLGAEAKIILPTAAQGTRPELDSVVWKPYETYMELSKRADIQKQKDPKRPNDFEVGDFFSPLMNRLLVKANRLTLKKASWVSQALFSEIQAFHEQVISQGQQILESGVLYGQLIAWTRAYSKLMSMQSSLTTLGRLHKVTFTKKEVTALRKNAFKFDVSKLMPKGSPIPYFLFFTDHKVTEMDFLRVRGVPIYFVGMSDRMIYADEYISDPYMYWVHDVLHAKNMLEADLPYFGAPNFTSAGYFGWRSANGKWTAFLNQTDQVKSDFTRSPFVEYLFNWFHNGGWDSNKVKAVLDESQKLGVFPSELADFPRYNLDP